MRDRVSEEIPQIQLFVSKLMIDVSSLKRLIDAKKKDFENVKTEYNEMNGKRPHLDKLKVKLCD